MSATPPFHPATVHFPIAFLSLSWCLDLLHHATTTTFPSLVSKSVPLVPRHLPTISLASHCLLGLGVVSSVVSAATGVAQLNKMVSNAGIYESDGKTIRPKIKIAFVHAALNDVTILAAAYSWYLRWQNATATTTTAGPSGTNVLISALSLPILLYSAHLGGILVYNHGVGFSLAKRPKTN